MGKWRQTGTAGTDMDNRNRDALIIPQSRRTGYEYFEKSRDDSNDYGIKF